MSVDVDQQQNIEALSTLWSGEGVLDDKDRLTCPLARFVTLGVVPGDLVDLKSTSGNGLVKVLQVEGEETLTIEDLNEALSYTGTTEGPFEVKVQRIIDKPCPMCQKLGRPKESDHLHCVRCQAERPLNDKGGHCQACIKWARQELVQHLRFEMEFPLFRGKVKVKLHARSVTECDSMQEWQDRMLLDNPKLSTNFVLENSAKAALAIALDDDGYGAKPSDLVNEGTPDDPYVRLPIMMKHFKGMSDAYYKALLTSLHRLDTLVEDACVYKIDAKYTEEQLMELAERLALKRPDEEVTGAITLFDGLEVLTFRVASTEEIEEAEQFTEAFIQGNRGKMLDGRGVFVKALARLACIFMEDSKAGFDGSTPFAEKLGYLMTLPMPLYYLYLAAGRIWMQRVREASEPEVLGNS